MHCGKFVSKVKDRVQSVLRTEDDVNRFYKYLQVRSDKDPEKNDLCTVRQLHDFCASIECLHCFRRVQNTIAYSFGDSENVPVEFLGTNPMEAILRFVDDPPSETSRFLAGLHESIDMSTEWSMPVGPQYGIGTFLRNLKCMLDQTVPLRWDAKSSGIEALETVTDEQNQYICMMADCVSEFVAAVFKFESTRPFKKGACVFVHALVDVFEKLFTALFNACHNVRERFHRSSTPSLANVNMRTYLDAYKANVEPVDYKKVLIALHILNLQRIEAFRVFYTEACDQIVMFESVFAHECARLWKYVDQDDFLLPLMDSPVKFMLMSQFELALGPLSRSAEYTQGPYPTVVQELGMLELRCSKIQQGHLEIWTRTKDRVIEQLLPEGFALTESMRADIDTARSDAVRMCMDAVQEYTAKMTMVAPGIDRTFRTDPLNALKQRGILRMANLRMLCDFLFGLRHLSALAGFLHDYHPAIQERVCGTDYHVRLCVKNVVLEKHIQMLLDQYLEYVREESFREMMEEAESVESKCVRNVAKKSKSSKQKKMEVPLPAQPVHEAPKALLPIVPAAAVAEKTSEDAEDDSAWEQVRSRKKSAADTVKASAHKNERAGGKSNPKAKKNQSSQSPYSYPSHTRDSSHHRIHAGDSTAVGGKRHRRVRACSPNPNRVVEPEPATVPEPEPVPPTPGPEPATVPEPEPSQPNPVLEPEPEPEPSVVTEAAAQTPTETQPQQSKRERRRGGGRSRKQQAAESAPFLNPAFLFSTAPTPVDPLILASYAASQVSQPVQMFQPQTVAVPARLFGGVLPREYASVPFMTFPRVYV